MKKRIVVSAEKERTFSQAFLMIFSAVIFYLIIILEDSSLASFYIFPCIFGIIAIYIIADYKNRKLVVFEWGFIFCNVFGNAKKVRTEEITKVQITSSRHVGTKVEFYTGDICAGSCSSKDNNYGLLMKYLCGSMLEKIDWCGYDNYFI